MKPLELSLHAPSHIVDVAGFFMEITAAYQDFERCVLLLLHRAPDISPAKIYHECEKLGEERRKLSALDDKLISILALAGTEVADTAMIQDYRVAFAKAAMACANLQQQLLAIRSTLAHAGVAVHGPPPSMA